MAGVGTKADIELLFGVLGSGSLSGESGKRIQQELSEIIKALDKADTFKIKVGLDADSTKKANWTQQLQKKLDKLNEGNRLTVAVSNLKLGGGAVADFKRQLSAVISTLNIDKDVSLTFTAKDIGEVKTEFKSAAEAAAEAARKAAEFKVQMEMLGNLKTSVRESLTTLTTGNESDEEKARVAELTAQYEQWAVKVEEIRASKQATSGEYKAALEAEGAAIQDNINKMHQERQAAAEADTAKTTAADEVAKAEAEYKRQLDLVNSALMSAKRNLENWTAAKGGKSSASYRVIEDEVHNLERLKERLVSTGRAASDFSKTYSDAARDIKTHSEYIRSTGEATKTFSDRVGGLAGKFTSWLTVSQVIMQLYRAMKRMVTVTVEIDTAMTELRKVTDETEQAYSQFLSNAAIRAKALGATLSEVITATADFARLGYTVGEAETLADAATIYKNVGDGIDDISDASESIISTMKAFGIEAENAMGIVDRFNEVGNNFAITSSGVGEALLRSASALAAANNTLDESIALITAANSVVQDPDAVGTTMKTVSMYLRAAKTEAEEAGESTEGMAESVSELRQELLSLTGGKVDIQLDSDTYKSTYQIMKELSEVWGELTDITQANILEQIGGKRNANAVAAILENFSVAEQALETAADSAGSALKENEKYLDSIEGKISQFKAGFQTLSSTLIDEEFVKQVIELGTGILKFLTALGKLINKLGGLNTALGVTLGLITTFKKAQVAQAIAKLIKPLAAIETAMAGTLGWVGIAMVAITGLITVYKALHKSNAELIEDAEELKSAYREFADETQSNIDTLKSLSDEFEELSEGVDEYGNNVSLASDDYERYREIVNTILGISPELIAGYDAEGKAIANKNGLLEKSIELMEQEQRLKMKEYTSKDNMVTMFEGEKAELEDTIRGIDISGDLDEILYGLSKAGEAGDSAFAYANSLAAYIEELTGISNDFGFDVEAYIQNNAAAIEAHLGEILNYVSNELVMYDPISGDWKRLTDAQISELRTYILAVTQAVDEASADARERLLYSAQLTEAYDELTDREKQFLTGYINTFNITTATAAEDLLQMQKNVEDFTAYIAENDALGETIDLAFSIKYGIDADGQALSVGQYKQYLSELCDEISGYAPEVQLKIKAALGIETDTAELNRELDAAIEHINTLLNGNVYNDEITQAYAKYKKALKKYTDGGFQSTDIKAVYGAMDELTAAAERAGHSVGDVLRTLRNGKSLEDIVDSMSTDDVLEIYYNVGAEPGSLSLDELEKLVEQLGIDWNATVEVLDFSDMAGGLSDIETGLESLISAMDTLRSGTRLTVKELSKLALEYPQLLECSDLFAETTIANQHAMLDAVLDTYENEYDALIDTKIKELEATNEALKAQIDLEQQKKDKVIEIADLQSNGKLDSEEEYQRLVDELYDMEGRNYASYSDGVLEVNADALEGQLTQTKQAAGQMKPIWGSVGNMIVEAHNKALNSALDTFPGYAQRLATWANTSLTTTLSGVSKKISYALVGDDGGAVAVPVDTSGIGKITASVPIELETAVEGDITIDSQKVDEWAAEYTENIDERVKTLQNQINTNLVIIDNLTKLKNLDLKSIYGFEDDDGSGSTGGSGGKTVEEYTAEIERYREALERLKRLTINKEDLELRLSNTDDPRELIEIERELLGVYQGEREILEEINALRDGTIANGVEALRQLGFVVDYDPDTNKLFVQNMEHINELTADSAGEYDTLQEATNALREDTEELIETLSDLNDENQADTDTWQELCYTIKNARVNIVNDLKEIVGQASEAVGSIAEVYEALRDTADEYAATGYISLDNFRKMTELGTEYMQYLTDENGLLEINEERIQAVIAAKTEQLALENAMSYIERLRLATQEDAVESLDTLLYATQETTDATWGLIYADLNLMKQLGELTDEQYEAAMHNINAIRSLSESAAKGIAVAADSARTELENMQDGLDDILDYVMDMLKSKIEQQVDALEELKDSYGEIISLKKESLEASRDETEYQEEVSKKVREIAKLQERINALSLDDSRDAQAQKAQLEEEMAELQKELSDTQADYALDAQKDALDDMQAAYEKEKDAEIEALEDSISSEQKLYDMAIEYIEDNWESLYDELIAWNYQYGSVLSSEITSAWDNALAAAQRYGSFVGALSGIGTDVDAASGEGTNSIVADSGNYDTAPSTEESVGAIVKRMYSNSKLYPTADEGTQKNLAKDNLALGASLAQYGVNAVRGDDGVWYIDKVGGERLYDRYRQYIYHTGGIAGNDGSLRENELLAKLEKGEAVISNGGKSALFSLIEFADLLSRKIDTTALFSTPLSPARTAQSAVPYIVPEGQGGQSVSFGDVYIYGANEETAARHRQINREFTNEVLRQLNIKR